MMRDFMVEKPWTYEIVKQREEDCQERSRVLTQLIRALTDWGVSVDAFDANGVHDTIAGEIYQWIRYEVSKEMAYNSSIWSTAASDLDVFETRSQKR